MRVQVEICVTSVEEAAAAAELGADSVEICSWLASGGLTPGPGLVSSIKERLKGGRTRSRVLVRPATGGFRYGHDERQVIMRDALLLTVADHEAGIVAGSLDENGLVDVQLMSTVRSVMDGRALTFHRAIDHASDMLMAVDQCRELGIERILSSGGQDRALDGVAMLKKMVERAGEKLAIAAGAGINAENVVRIVEGTGVVEVHLSAQRPRSIISSGAAMSAAYAGVNFEVEPDRAKIEGVMNALAKAGLR